jgi:decaprenylphospho-beta-D-ribofuranose 2-oxidase
VSTAQRQEFESVLSGWGRVPVVQGAELRSEDLARLTEDLPLTRGLGRAYGDAALPAPSDRLVAGTTLADRILSFDPETAVLTAEAGLSLDELCRVFLPRGFFTPVSPGTRFVTLGGMVACDVHGKNHHREGTLGSHVLSLTIRTGTGDVVRCSAKEHDDLFRATIGGMGLTGAILDVTLRLVRVPSTSILEECERVHDIDQSLDALKSASARWPMTAGWIDCLASGRHLGRGVVFRGRWAEPHEVPPSPRSQPRNLTVPFDIPGWVLTEPAVRVFNALIYWRYRARHPSAIVHPYTFLYPLDAVAHWTRLYGSRGFTQYQCVLPDSSGREAVARFLTVLTRRGGASFLTVIKDCGAEGIGLLSFPRPGISIAVDLPMRRHNTQSLVDALNEVVIAEGGRVYLAKDALTRPEHFRAMEPRLDAFLAVRRKWDPERRIRSAQSVRLFGW